MGKWTRRAFITTGVLAGGALAVGVAIRPGHRAPKVADQVARNGETLLSMWVKIAPDNRVTLIAPHSEMGQGAHTALTQMLADEMDARWEDMDYLEAPAIDEYANWALGKGFLVGPANIPRALVPTIDGAFLQIAKAMKLQITGGSTSVRATGVYGVRVAGAAARELLLSAAGEAWGVPVGQLRTRGHAHCRARRRGAARPVRRVRAGRGAASAVALTSAQVTRAVPDHGHQPPASGYPVQGRRQRRLWHRCAGAGHEVRGHHRGAGIRCAGGIGGEQRGRGHARRAARGHAGRRGGGGGGRLLAGQPGSAGARYRVDADGK
jgi:CO/xanthine dehydrogenase Mo-binding subunit